MIKKWFFGCTDDGKSYLLQWCEAQVHLYHDAMYNTLSIYHSVSTCYYKLFFVITFKLPNQNFNSQAIKHISFFLF